MQKEWLIIICAVLLIALSCYLLYLLSPLVKIIGWTVLIAGFGIGIFFLAKFISKLINK